MRQLLFSLSMILCLFAHLQVHAQSPESFNYQAVVRDAGGNVLANQAVSFRMNILAGSATGTTVYAETHAATTNSFGLVNLQIGQGTVVSGTFSNIDWGNNSHFIEIELDETGGTAYTSLGTQQLISVPYALHAKTVENDAVDDADADPNNELQNLSLNGDTLTISNGNNVVLPQVVDTDDQNLSISNDSLIIQDGNAVDLSPYLDNTDAQILSRSNDTLFLTNGGFAIIADAAFSTTDSVTSNAPGNYAVDDFVFGSPDLDNTSNSDHDSRMFFDKSKSALRVGSADSSQWDQANIGRYSFAAGEDVVASGNWSFATGIKTTASGRYSFAGGQSSVSSGNSSVAVGAFNQATNQGSIALGGFNITSGEFATAFGYNLTAPSTYEFVLGRFNTPYFPAGGSSNWVGTDRLVTIGNGTGAFNTSDAMVILKNGNIGIGTSVPAEALHVEGSIRMDDGNQATGYLPVSDANGTMVWTDPDSVFQATSQTISISNDTVSLSGGSFAILPPDQVNDADANPTNEIQSLNLSGNNLSISGGNTVTLPALVDTDDQNLSISNDSLIIQDGNAVDLSPYLDNTDQQTLSLNSNNLAIQNGNSVDLSPYLDNTDAQIISISNDTIFLSNGGFAVLPPDSASDGDWRLSGNDLVNLNSGNVAIGVSTPAAKLEVGGDIYLRRFGNFPRRIAFRNQNGEFNWKIEQLGGNANAPLVIGGGNTNFVTGGLIERLRIDANGRVGINLGNISGAQLHVKGDIRSSSTGLINSYIEMFHGGQNAFFNWAGAGNLDFRYQNNDRMTLTQAGNLGLGTTSPAERLHVSGSIRMDDGNQAAGYIPVSDANGTMTWTNPNAVFQDAQVISISNDTVFVSNGGFAVLPAQTVDTDDQNLSISNDSLIIQDGNAVDLSPYLDNTDAQVISISNDTVFLSNGGFALLPATIPALVSDLDGDTKIEVEQSPDVDQIHFSTAGTERWRMVGSRIEPLNSNDNLLIGEGTGQNITTGVSNMYIGKLAGSSNETGIDNVGLGNRALQLSQSGFRNTAVGVRTMQQKTSGINNSAFGEEALQNNTIGSNNLALGYRAGLNNLTGSGNVFIGPDAGANETGSNRLYIDNSNAGTPLVYGEFDNDIVAVNGRLGVGTMNPSAPLDVDSTAVIGQIAVGTESTDQAASNDAGRGFTTTPWLYSHALEAHDERGPMSTLITVGNDGRYGAADEIHFVTSGNRRMKVDASGNVGIGNPNPGARLHVNQDVTGTNYPLKIHNLANTTDSHGAEIAAGSNIAGGSDLIVFRRPNFARIGAVNQNGAGSVQYQTTSDRRLKTDIQPTRYGLGNLMQIQVSDYRYLAEQEQVRTGFIAQQLHQVYPEAVRVGGEDAAENPWMVDYSQLTPLLVKSMQEQQAVIESQQKEISHLKAEMQELKAMVRKEIEK